MQAFQQKSEIKEDETEDFYKSYHEEEERKRQEQEAEEAAQAAQQAQEEAEAAQTQESEPEKPKFVEITHDNPTKDPEIAQKEGVAYWTKMCDVDESEPKKAKKVAKSRDLPSKAQVDAQQAEQETWADRWYQNKKVQKVVQDSKIFSKVKANIKTKFVKETAEDEAEVRPGTSAKDLKAEALRRKLNKNPQNKEFPVIGSFDEYSKIKGKSEAAEAKSESSEEESEEEEEGDGLWSAIMGKK